LLECERHEDWLTNLVLSEKISGEYLLFQE
jgi:hypothetical protein